MSNAKKIAIIVTILLGVVESKASELDADLIYQCEIVKSSKNVACIKYCKLVDKLRVNDILKICEDEQVHGDY